MPLYDDYRADIRLRLGLTVPPLAQQADGFGLVLNNPELWEDRHRAFNLLRVGGFFTDAECERIAQRLLKGVSRELGYEVALSDLALQILAANEEAIANAGQEPVKEEGSEMDHSTDAHALATNPPNTITDALDSYLQSKQAG